MADREKRKKVLWVGEGDKLPPATPPKLKPTDVGYIPNGVDLVGVIAMLVIIGIMVVVFLWVN